MRVRVLARMRAVFALVGQSACPGLVRHLRFADVEREIADVAVVVRHPHALEVDAAVRVARRRRFEIDGAALRARYVRLRRRVAPLGERGRRGARKNTAQSGAMQLVPRGARHGAETYVRSASESTRDETEGCPTITRARVADATRLSQFRKSGERVMSDRSSSVVGLAAALLAARLARRGASLVRRHLRLGQAGEGDRHGHAPRVDESAHVDLPRCEERMPARSKPGHSSSAAPTA